MAAGTVSEPAGAGGARVRVSLLGPFTIKRGGRGAGPWYRPPAKRLCELVMVSPGLRVGRELAQEMLFADLGPSAAANALSRALSLARGALSPLGGEVRGLLQADRAQHTGPPLTFPWTSTWWRTRQPCGRLWPWSGALSGHGFMYGTGRRWRPARRRALRRLGAPAPRGPRAPAPKSPFRAGPGPQHGPRALRSRGGHRSLGSLPGPRCGVRRGGFIVDAHLFSSGPASVGVASL